MPSFPKPRFAFDYSVATEAGRLRAHARHRQIPRKRRDHLLVATWNIANLGAQKRRAKDLRLIAEILGWFDLVAVQECRDDVTHLHGVLDHLPASYRLLFSDPGGNNERMAFVYDGRKVTPLEKVGEIAVPPAHARHVKIRGVARRFTGFDRNPYLAAFEALGRRFLAINVHLYYGSAGKASVERRALETLAVARWADQRRRSRLAYTKDIFAMGDFNMPKRDKGDPIHDALTGRGLALPAHSSELGSNLSSDKHYDQIAYFPGESGDMLMGSGVFDFDAVIFRRLWETRAEKDFRAYCRYYISDHRPLWFQLAGA